VSYGHDTLHGTEEPGMPKRSGAHCLQVMLPALSEYVFAGHSAQIDFEPPLVDANVPAGHSVHARAAAPSVY
jgi:hypothetical protein